MIPTTPNKTGILTIPVNAYVVKSNNGGLEFKWFNSSDAHDDLSKWFNVQMYKYLFPHVLLTSFISYLLVTSFTSHLLVTSFTSYLLVLLVTY